MIERMPRGPLVFNEKSGTTDYEDGYVSKLNRFREAAREQAMRELRSNKEWNNVSKYTRALEGNIWPKDRPRFRSQFVDNNLSRARKETLAQYTDTKPTIMVQGSHGLDQQAQTLTKQCIHSWMSENLDIELIRVLDHAMLSHGYWKVDATRGRVTVSTCGMDTVRPINCDGDLQHSSAVIYGRHKALSYFVNKWGKKVAEKILQDTNRGRRETTPVSNTGPGMQMDSYSWNRLSPSMRYIHRDLNPDQSDYNTGDLFPVAELEELWSEDDSVNESLRDVIVKDPNYPISDHNYWYRVKPGGRMYPRKRLMVFGANTPLYDGPSPYWYDGFPFVMLTLDPIVWGAGGLSKYRSLYPLNMGLNEISAGLFDTIKKALNQVYVAKRGSVNPADWDRFFPEIPGQRMLLNNTADIRDVRALDPPQIPQGAFEFARALTAVFDRHAGSVDVMGLTKKKQVPGGDTMEQIRDMQTAPIRLEGRYIEAFLRDVGMIAVSHYLQYYTYKERYLIIGPDGVTMDDYNWDPTTMIPANEAREVHWKKYKIMIAPGSLHGSNKDRDQIKAITLFKAGSLSRRTLLEKFDIVNPEEEFKRMAAEQKAGLGQPAPGGRTPRATRGQRTGGVA